MPNRKNIPRPPFLIGVTVNLAADLKTSDHLMAYDFLRGRPAGPVEHRKSFLGSEREAMARDALVRVLRGEGTVPPTIRNLLADLFDPAAKCARKITIKFREKGQPPDHAMAHMVGSYIERRSKEILQKEAIAEMSERYCVSKDQIRGYLKIYRSSKR
jgi:hypothetical protein